MCPSCLPHMQRPAVMTPRSPRGAEDALPSPLNLQTPHTPGTPLVLLSPSADASGYLLASMPSALAAGAGLVAYHSTEVVTAAGSGALGRALDLESLQVGARQWGRTLVPAGMCLTACLDAACEHW